MAHFDGTALYEHADPRKGFQPDWNTAIYNFGRTEVANFLYCNALYWVDRFHIDGLRVDAVASMLYLDYSRKEGEWLPNADGSKENREAIAFLRRANELVYGGFPGAVTIAEESTAFPGVSRPTDQGGLGFGFKWNMGWMHDTLDYVSEDPIYRRWHHNKMTFGLLYAFSENFVLPISHDEVVHGKRSVIGKMPGDEWQRFANARAFYGFMWGHPGKKLLFMGQEFGQTNEWNASDSLPWWLLDIGRIRASRLGSAILTVSIARRPLSMRAIASLTVSAGSWSTTRSSRCWPFFAGRAERSTGCGRLQFHSGAARGLPSWPALSGFLARGAQQRRRPLRWIQHGQFRRRDGAEQPLHGFPASATLTLPPLATLFLVFSPPAASGGILTTEFAMPKMKTAKELGVSAPYSRHAMAYVLAGGRGSRLLELTDRRAKPAVYFGGKSRIIDFALSNALNSGIRRIAVATQYKAHSLIRHLQRGWNFLRPERNESFDVLPASQRVSETMWYLGTADAVYQNIDIIEGYGPHFIVLLAGDHVYKWTTRRCSSSTSIWGPT